MTIKDTEFNFFQMGQNHIEDTLEEIAILAKQIENKYGVLARQEFEVGFATKISQYADAFIHEGVNISEFHAFTSLDTHPNERNNSYLGEEKAPTYSQKYDENGQYIELSPEDLARIRKNQR